MPEVSPDDRYDRIDMVRQEAVIAAGPMKMAAYRVCDPATQLFGGIQFHLTYDNTVMAVMGEEAAKFFTKFYRDTMGIQNAVPAEAEWLPEKDAPQGLHCTFRVGESGPSWAWLGLHMEQRIWTSPFGHDTIANSGSYAAPTHFLSVKMPPFPTEV